MDFIEAIHERAIQAVSRFKQAEADLVCIFQALDDSRAFLDLGHTSLFSYAVSLGLSESVTYNLIAVARKAKEMPVLQSAIQRGELSVSKARKITSVLELGNQEEWVVKAQTLSSRRLEEEVAKLNPVVSVRESVRPVCKERFELKLGISKQLEEKLKRVQDLESKRTSQAATLEQALEATVDLYLERKDPVFKAAQAEKRILNKSVKKPVTGQVEMPAGLRHQANLRDGGQCTHLSKGVRCANKRWVDLHHIHRRSEGGDHSVDNLATLCSVHHRIEREFR